MNAEVPRPRALVVTLDPALGGGVRTMQRAVCEAQERLGFSVHVAFPRAGRLARWALRVRSETIDGRAAFSVGYMPSIEYLNYTVPALLLRRTFRDFPLVHVVSGCHSLAMIPALAQKPFVSWVATAFIDEVRSQRDADHPTLSARINNALSPINCALEGWSLRQARAVLALSSYTERSLAATAGLGPERLRLLRCPVDTARFSPDGPCLAELPRPYILTVGRVDDGRKNHPALLRVFSHLARTHNDLSLVVVGEIAERSPVRALAADLGLSERVAYVGPFEGDRLAAAYRGAELFVLTSRQEGLGIVILEAQASGVAPVIMRCGGGEELIRDGVDGWAIEQGDEEGLARLVTRLLASTDTRRAAGESARRRVEAEGSFSVFDCKLLEVYREVFPAAGVALE